MAAIFEEHGQGDEFQTDRSNTKEQKASFQYFENRDCQYYPCHNLQASGFNCLFCFCPIYSAICPGTPQYKEKNGVLFKSCADCEYPHMPENHRAIIEYIASMLEDGQNE